MRFTFKGHRDDFKKLSTSGSSTRLYSVIREIYGDKPLCGRLFKDWGPIKNTSEQKKPYDEDPERRSIYASVHMLDDRKPPWHIHIVYMYICMSGLEVRDPSWGYSRIWGVYMCAWRQYMYAYGYRSRRVYVRMRTRMRTSKCT